MRFAALVSWLLLCSTLYARLQQKGNILGRSAPHQSTVAAAATTHEEPARFRDCPRANIVEPLSYNGYRYSAQIINKPVFPVICWTVLRGQIEQYIRDNNVSPETPWSVYVIEVPVSELPSNFCSLFSRLQVFETELHAAVLPSGIFTEECQGLTHMQIHVFLENGVFSVQSGAVPLQSNLEFVGVSALVDSSITIKLNKNALLGQNLKELAIGAPHIVLDSSISGGNALPDTVVLVSNHIQTNAPCSKKRIERSIELSLYRMKQTESLRLDGPLLQKQCFESKVNVDSFRTALKALQESPPTRVGVFFSDIQMSEALIPSLVDELLLIRALNDGRLFVKDKNNSEPISTRYVHRMLSYAGQQ